jgi:hypothetical protein
MELRMRKYIEKSTTRTSSTTLNLRANFFGFTDFPFNPFKPEIHQANYSRFGKYNEAKKKYAGA